MAPFDQVDAAMALLDQIQDVLSDDRARGDLAGLFTKLGIWVGVSFAEGIKGTKRKVRQLTGGIVAFGDAELRVKLHGKDRVDVTSDDNARPAEGPAQTKEFRPGATLASNTGNSSPDRRPPGLVDSQREGISDTKDSRGDKTPIELFRTGATELTAAVQKQIAESSLPPPNSL